VRAIDRVACEWKQFNCLAAFADCFLFATKAGIDQAEDGNRRRVTRLRGDGFCLLRPRRRESRLRRSGVTPRPRGQGFTESAAELSGTRVFSLLSEKSNSIS
jgi:hypothetical protein